MKTAVRGAGRLSETEGSCVFSYVLHKNVLDRSERKPIKRAKKVKEKSGIFVIKIEWQPCARLQTYYFPLLFTTPSSRQLSSILLTELAFQEFLK